MTGEITLRGRVLPIGGVKEKVLGAHRAGCTHILVPKDNEADLDDLPEDVREALTFHCVSTLDEALEITLATPALSGSSGEAYNGQAGFEDSALAGKRVAIHA
jgi:ATP-dependent Lon protease